MTPSYVKNIHLEKLPLFCEELRSKLIEIMSKTGGHIGVNLGTVELTVALYRVFDFPKNDSIVWDIGHQIYVQKMITERLKNLETGRNDGGSPNYAFRDESEFDRVTSSHAGASVSLALGTGIVNKLQGKNNFSIGVVGDGSYVEGSIQEAINHLAKESTKTIIILNDNERAIEENFGGLHEYFKTRQVGVNKKETFFSSLGLNYNGPVDGHNVLKLIETLSELKEKMQGPTILHVKTIKGKGLENMADISPMRIHWNHKFDPVSGENTEIPRSKGYASFAGEAILKIMERNSNATLITPAVQSNLGITSVFKKIPKRCFDVSLAEQHAFTLAGGFALEGYKPIVAMEATFMCRGFDQISHDLCINKLPVLIIAARSGHGGTDHITHNALQDLAYLRCIPNMRIRVVSSHKDIEKIFNYEFENLVQPTTILFAKADILDDPKIDLITDDSNKIEKTKSARGLILSVGPQNNNANELKENLAKEKIIFDHVAITKIHPMEQKILNILSEYEYIVTLEEGTLDGGFGSLISEYVSDQELKIKVLRIGFNKQFIENGSREYLYKKYQLDAKSIIEKMRTKWEELWD